MKKHLLKSLFLTAILAMGTTSAKALDYDEDGKAIIATAQDLVDYANWWNNNPKEGKIQGVDAYLTADIDMSGIDFPGIGHDGHENNRFHATLDGRGHRIKNLVMNGNEIALIRVASDNVVIKNLILDKTCSFTGTGRNAAFISASNWPEWGSGKIEFYNCGNEAEVVGTGANCAAYVGCNYSGNLGIVVKNCYNTGHIKGDRESAVISGWLGSNDNNSVSYIWNIAEVEGVEGDNYLTRGNLPQSGHLFNTKSNGNGATQFDESWLASGELCWNLNQGQEEMQWFQTLATDAAPTFNADSKPVYKNGQFTCGGESKGSFTFGNADEATYDEHVVGDNDICTVCGQGIEPTAVNGVYQIASIGHMLWLANEVNTLGHNELAAVLTADLRQGELPYVPVGNGTNPYKGHFDGQGHSITLNINADANYQGIFGVITDGVHIENLIAKGTITGKDFVGGIAGGTNGGSNNQQKTWLQNCGNEATVTAKNNNAGGMIGVNMGGSASFLIQNCYNTGVITGNESGAFSGWSGGGWSTIENSWSTGSVNEGGDFSRNNGTNFTNCYAVAGINGVTTISAEAVASGELCWKLNDGQEEMQWFQTLGTDATPTLSADSKPVYKVGDTYTNMPFAISAVSGENSTVLTEGAELAEATALTISTVKTYENLTVSVSKRIWNEPMIEWGETEGYYTEEDVTVDDPIEKNEDGTWTATFMKQPQNFADGFDYQIKVRGFEGEMFDEDWNLMPFDEAIITIHGTGEQDAIEIEMGFCESEITGRDDETWEIKADEFAGVILSYPQNNVVEALGEEKAANVVLAVNEAYLLNVDAEGNADLEKPLASITNQEAQGYETITLFADVKLQAGKSYVFYVPARGLALIDKTAEGEDALLWTNAGMWDEIYAPFTTADTRTAIDGITVANGKVIFNVAGQRLNKTQKGVNIINGKKVMVK